MAKSSTGLEENIAALLSYALGWVTGLVFFLVEKDSKFVKFHAMQSMIVFIPLMVLSWLFSRILWFIGGIFGLASFVLWIILMIKAYQGEKFKLPYIGDLAEKWSA